MYADKWTQHQWSWMTAEQKELIEGAAVAFRLDGSHPKSEKRFWDSFELQWMAACTGVRELVESGELPPEAQKIDYKLNDEEAELVDHYKVRCCKKAVLAMIWYQRVQEQLDGMYSLTEGPRLPLSRKPSKTLRSWP